MRSKHLYGYQAAPGVHARDIQHVGSAFPRNATHHPCRKYPQPLRIRKPGLDTWNNQKTQSHFLDLQKQSAPARRELPNPGRCDRRSGVETSARSPEGLATRAAGMLRQLGLWLSKAQFLFAGQLGSRRIGLVSGATPCAKLAQAQGENGSKLVQHNDIDFLPAPGSSETACWPVPAERC